MDIQIWRWVVPQIRFQSKCNAVLQGTGTSRGMNDNPPSSGFTVSVATSIRFVEQL
jgi:hypothetical protein